MLLISPIKNGTSATNVVLILAPWKQHLPSLNIHRAPKKLYTGGHDLEFPWESADWGFPLGRQGRRHRGHYGEIRVSSPICRGLTCRECGHRRQRQGQREAMIIYFKLYPEPVEVALSKEMTWSHLWPRKTSLLGMRVWYKMWYLIIDSQFSMWSQLALSLFFWSWFCLLIAAFSFVSLIYSTYLPDPWRYLHSQPLS